MKKRVLSIILTLCMVLALVPIMPVTVSAASTGYTVLAGSGGNNNQGHDKLVDGSVDSKWCVQLSLSPYIIFETPTDVNVSGYDITTGDDTATQIGRNPKSWTLYGCNDYLESGGTWETIHSVTDDAVLENKNKTTYHYVFDKTETAYKYFKLEITATKGASLMQMSEFVLTDCDHSWNTETKEPTCTEGGYTTTTCTKCGRVKETSNYTDKLGHNFGENGICTHCGSSVIFDISQGNVQIFDDENNPGKIKVRYGNGVYLLNIDPKTVITVTGTTAKYELKVETDTPVTIKAKNLSIDSSTRKYSYAMVLIGSNDSADVTLILEGTNIFKGGYQKAGITAGIGKKLTIEGDGSVTANGGSQASGIGGEVNSSCGTIIIKSGTVTADGGSQASGIGGGGVYSQSTGGGGGTVIIIGGTVNATGKSGSADIGGGINNRTGTVIITGGNVNAANNKKTGNAGIKSTDNGALAAYGEFTIPVDLTIPAGKTLTVPESVTMTIPEGVALTNDGTIINNGTIANNGAIYVNGTFKGTADNLYYPLTVINATASGDTSEYNGTIYAKLGSEITLSCTIPEGKYLVRWDGLSSDVTVENNKFTMPAEALTVTPQIDNIQYTVKFNTFGGSTIADKTNVIWTDKVLDGIENPTKKGHSFLGWKCGDKLVTEETACSELASADDVTEIVLVARWTDNSLYSTKEQLMNLFTPNGEGTPDIIGKLVFGKNSGKTAQEWYILGKDSGVAGDNTIIFAASPIATKQKFASSKNNVILEYDIVYESNIKEVYANHYGASDLRAALKAMAVNPSYFTIAEQGLMNSTAVKTSDEKNRVTYTTRDRLYALQGEISNNKLWAGSNDGTVLAVDSYWNSGEYFWLRSPSNNSDGALITYPGRIVNLTSVLNPYDLRPAANLNLTNVLFASAATAASDAVSAGTIHSGTAITLRLDGSDKAIGTVMYDTADGLILAKKSADAKGTVSLVVQVGNGTDTFFYSLPVNGTTFVSAEQIKNKCGISGLFLADCKIWLETTIDNVSYAKTAEEKDIKIISSVEITGVKPVAGEELSTTASCVTAGIATTAPAITYRADGAEVTGKADWNKTYEAKVTLDVIDTVDTVYAFGDTVSVTVEGEELTSAIAPNADGTLTVTKEYTTDKRKLAAVAAPTAPTTFENYYVIEGYGDVLTDGGNNELSKQATVTFEDSFEPTSANINVIWTVEGGNEAYDGTPGATNTFRWTVPAAALVNYDAANCTGYDAERGTITGTVEITNKAATPVVITASDTFIYFTGTQIDMSEYFKIDGNAGSATYSISGGTGVGTINGSMLTVKKIGTFEITVNTAANGIYAAGEAITYLNVGYNPTFDCDFNGDGAANIIDLVRLKKIIAGDAQIEGVSHDLDGSGSYDAADLTILKKFLLGIITVRSEAQLRAAVEMLAADPAGGRIALNNDIDLGIEGLSISETQTGEVTLDLNGHTLSGTDTSISDGINVLIASFAQTALNIENGALELKYNKPTNADNVAIFKLGGILRLKNCTVCTVNSNASAAIFGQFSSIELENCSLNGYLADNDGNKVTVSGMGAVITAKGNVSVQNKFLCQDYNNIPWSLTLKAGGTYSFNGENVSVTEDTTYSSGSETLPGWFYQSSW